MTEQGSERAHMYLSRLFILFHFNIAIDVIAAVEFVCLLYWVSFSPLWNFPIYAQPIVCDVEVCKCPRRKSDVIQKFFKCVFMCGARAISCIWLLLSLSLMHLSIDRTILLRQIFEIQHLRLKTTTTRWIWLYCFILNRKFYHQNDGCACWTAAT